MTILRVAALYVLFCIIGTILEWSYGHLWSLVGGTAPWLYPNSPLGYTSLEVIPLWGFGGLICVSVYRALIEKKLRPLLGAGLSLILAALWICLR